MNKLRKGDQVIVLTGRDKGKRGTVLRRVDAEHVVVEGINRVKKHQRPNPMKGETGGIVDKDMPIHVSNVAIADPKSGKPTRVGIIPAFFDSEEEIPWSLRKESDEFDYGYALTVHKAQGSQWDRVVLFDESYAFREHRARWLYTALTRAAETITVVM
mgnify:CR=1 FL=1